MRPTPLTRLLFALVLLGGGASPCLSQGELMVDGRPAAVRKDGPCFDNANRFVDCGNGTVTDSVTGLIWLRQATCVDYAGAGGTNLADNWPDAMAAAAAVGEPMCGLSDGSVAGDWRLPTDEEWAATLAPAALGCVAAPGPAWTNDAGTGCYDDGTASSFLLVADLTYWSSTATELGTSTESAFAADLAGGDIDTLLKFTPNRSIWVVRRGW